MDEELVVTVRVTKSQHAGVANALYLMFVVYWRQKNISLLALEYLINKLIERKKQQVDEESRRKRADILRI